MTWQEKFQNGIAYQQAGRRDAAERSYRASIAANPRFGAAQHNLGAVLHLRGRFRQAIHAFEMSAKLDPDLAGPAHLGIGAVLTQAGDYGRAETELRAAIAATPTAVDPHRFLGDLMRTVGCMEDARQAYLHAVRLNPAEPESRFGLASVRLALGEMPGGWDDYEFRKSKLATPALQPFWNGEDIVGRTLLVHSEQGLGDAIQFLRYVPLLAARRATVLLAVRQEIMALASTVEGAARVVEPTYTLPSFDYSCALPSLPRLFQTTLETIPGNVPYIRADPGRIEAWREKLAGWDGLTVAIAWRGNPTHRNDHHRSILNGEIAPLFKAPNFRFLVLQQEDGDTPRAANVTKLGGQNLDDIAAIMSVSDLTISVDTVFCHLAGALGLPVWTMLNSSPDWRWLRDGETTPWYPTMRLFRQKTLDNWADVVGDVVKALADVPRRQA